MKSHKTITLCVLAIFLNGCISDLRTLSIKKNGITNETANKGREILNKSAKAHGIEQWKQYKTAEMTYSGKWKPPVSWLANLYPNNKPKAKFQVILGTFNSRTELLNGKKEGEIWGIQSWNTYKIKPGKKIDFKKDKGLEFGLPTFQYFFEFPFRIISAPIVVYAGEKRINGKKYHLVFATWNKPEPHKQNDQYLIYINKETFLTEYALYTIRDKFKFLKSYISYDDFNNVDGVIIPFTLINKLKLNGKGFHNGKISDISFDAIPGDILLPDKKLIYMGDEKSE